MKLKLYKKKLDYSFSTGVYSTIELLKHRPQDVIKVMLSSKGESNEGIHLIKKLALEKGIFVEYADAQVEKLSQSDNNYALGIFNKYTTALEQDKNHIVLVNPSDMGNLGTITRTMLGFDHLNLAIIKPAADIFDPKVIRASMGAIFQLKFEYFESFDDYSKKFSTHKLYPFMIREAETLDQLKLESPRSLIFGNEGAGLDEKYAELGTPVKIPQSDKVDSLNLAVSVGIALYESSRA